MQPGKKPIKELAALPFIYGVLVGTAFGMMEVFKKPQVIHKPAMKRYYDSMGMNKPKSDRGYLDSPPSTE